jgi:hypothetical protein
MSKRYNVALIVVAMTNLFPRLGPIGCLILRRLYN